MFEQSSTINDLIVKIYECQKKIKIKKEIILDPESSSTDMSMLKKEIKKLENKMKLYQLKLKKKYYS